MSTCFKCAGPEGVARRSHAMAKDWYETSAPARTIALCDDCYAPASDRGQSWDAGPSSRDLGVWAEVKFGSPEFGYRQRVIGVSDELAAA